MGSSGEQVTERLEELRDSYPGTPVEQTTILVEPSVRNRVRAATGVLDARVRVENETGEVLCVRENDNWQLPRVQISDDEDIDHVVCQQVADETGIEPVLDDLRIVTITGYQCSECPDEDDRIYRLTADFEAVPETGSPDSEAAWRVLEE